jgi:hypothetical protein
VTENARNGRIGGIPTMKKLVMFIFSIIFTVFSALTLLWSVEVIMMARGTPIISAGFMENELVQKMMTSWEIETVREFMSQWLYFLQIIGIVLFAICVLIETIIMRPQRHYESINDFRRFTRSHLMLYRIGNILFLLSFIAHGVEVLIRPGGGLNGEFGQIVAFIGIPWLIFLSFTMPKSFDIIFSGIMRNSWCDECNYGSKGQYKVTASSSSTTKTGTEITTTTYGDGSKRVSSRGIFRRSSSTTYTCRNCGAYFTTRSSSEERR